MSVHQKLGSGFLEAVYMEALEKEFVKLNIPYEREKRLSLFYDGIKMDKYYRCDFLCYGKIILEIKAASFIVDNFKKQVLNYLKSTNMKLGILINFGKPSLEYKRIINSHASL